MANESLLTLYAKGRLCSGSTPCCTVHPLIRSEYLVWSLEAGMLLHRKLAQSALLPFLFLLLFTPRHGPAYLLEVRYTTPWIAMLAPYRFLQGDTSRWVVFIYRAPQNGYAPSVAVPSHSEEPFRGTLYSQACGILGRCVNLLLRLSRNSRKWIEIGRFAVNNDLFEPMEFAADSAPPG